MKELTNGTQFGMRILKIPILQRILHIHKIPVLQKARIRTARTSESLLPERSTQ